MSKNFDSSGFRRVFGESRLAETSTKWTPCKSVGVISMALPTTSPRIRPSASAKARRQDRHTRSRSPNTLLGGGFSYIKSNSNMALSPISSNQTFWKTSQAASMVLSMTWGSSKALDNIAPRTSEFFAGKNEAVPVRDMIWDWAYRELLTNIFQTRIYQLRYIIKSPLLGWA